MSDDALGLSATELEIQRLHAEALEKIQEAEALLRDESLGEMERQIAQCRLQELAFNLLQQSALLSGDSRSLKTYADKALEWANAGRSASTKRKNDEVPRLIELLENRVEFARKLMTIEQDD